MIQWWTWLNSYSMPKLLILFFVKQVTSLNLCNYLTAESEENIQAKGSAVPESGWWTHELEMMHQNHWHEGGTVDFDANFHSPGNRQHYNLATGHEQSIASLGGRPDRHILTGNVSESLPKTSKISHLLTAHWESYDQTIRNFETKKIRNMINRLWAKQKSPVGHISICASFDLSIQVKNQTMDHSIRLHWPMGFELARVCDHPLLLPEQELKTVKRLVVWSSYKTPLLFLKSDLNIVFFFF